jgi:hypothetical protein
VHLLQSRTSEAIVWFERARSANPLRPIVHAHLASAYALNGEFEHAVAELAEARRLSGDDRYASIDRLKAVGFLGIARIRALHEATYFAGLRKAGCRRNNRPQSAVSRRRSLGSGRSRSRLGPTTATPIFADISADARTFRHALAAASASQ